MRVDNIQGNSFEGKVKFDKRLTKPMLDYANKILDAPFSGTTARERIANATYDVEIGGKATKRTIHPGIFFSSEFKSLRDPKQFSLSREHYYCSPRIRVHSTVSEGAYELNQYLTRLEEYKSWHKYSYNTFGEKVSAFFKRMFGVRK